MSTFVWRGGTFVDKKTGQPMEVVDTGEIRMPMVMRDTPEYRSPIDGRLITSRSERREDLRRNGCYEVDPPKKGTRHFKNKAWVKKRNLPMEL